MFLLGLICGVVLTIAVSIFVGKPNSLTFKDAAAIHYRDRS